MDLGGGIEGATTTALNADVVGFSRARGLFAGVSLGGSMLSTKSDWNAAYYGRPVGVQQVVLTMEATNPAADPLRAVLSRYGQQVAQNGGPAPVQDGPIQGVPGRMGGGRQVRHCRRALRSSSSSLVRRLGVTDADDTLVAAALDAATTRSA